MTKTLNTQTTDCFYIPAFQKSLFQVKPGISVISALEEAQSMAVCIREMLYNYPDHEQAANSAGCMMQFVEGLIESAQMALREAGYRGDCPVPDAPAQPG